MPKAQSPDRVKAEKLYIKSNGTIKLIDIASQLNIPEGTIRGWKNKDKWDDKLNGTFQKDMERSEKKDKNVTYKDNIVEENPDLTEKQRLFCLYYIKSFNGTMAAIKAGYEPSSAHVRASELVRNSKIIAEIKRLKGTAQQELFIDAMDVLRKYIKIAFADMNDFVEVGTRDVNIYKNGEIIDTVTKSFVDFKPSNHIDGSLICEIKQNKDGASLKLEDRQKALDKLAEYFDLFPDKFKREIESQKLELLKRRDGDTDDTEMEDDGFIDALKGEVSKVWEENKDE